MRGARAAGGRDRGQALGGRPGRCPGEFCGQPPGRPGRRGGAGAAALPAEAEQSPQGLEPSRKPFPSTMTSKTARPFCYTPASTSHLRGEKSTNGEFSPADSRFEGENSTMVDFWPREGGGIEW